MKVWALASPPSTLGGGFLAFAWGGGGLNTLLDARKRTFNLGAEELKRARKLSHTLQIITRRFKRAKWLQNPGRLGGPCTSERGTESAVAYKWAGWL